MIGLLLLISLGLWIGASVMLSKPIPRWLGIKKHQTTISVLLFPLVLVVPVTDDLIGRWQFYQLCDKEAVMTLSPDWGRVKRARHRDLPIVNLDGFLIPIRSQREEYLDTDTGRIFLTNQGFHTYGGFLLGRFRQTFSCWPKDVSSTYKQIRLDSLIGEGVTK